MPSGAAWAIKRPHGTYFVQVRRSGVEPSGGCLLGFPLWLVTRLRWQLSHDRSWTVEVVAPLALRQLIRSQRRLLLESYETEEAAMKAAEGIAQRAAGGEFD